MGRVHSFRADDATDDRIAEHLARTGDTESDFLRILTERFFAAGSPSSAGDDHNAVAGANASRRSGDGTFSSDDPAADAAASSAGEAARGNGPGIPDRLGAGNAGRGGGPDRATGSSLEALQLENALLKELLPLRLAVDPALLVAALAPLSKFGEDGRVRVEWDGQEHALADAIPANLRASSGGGGSGSRAPRDIGTIPAPKSEIEKALGSQAYFESNREKVVAAERREGLGNAKRP
jgi:hypothetical protein